MRASLAPLALILVLLIGCYSRNSTPEHLYPVPLPLAIEGIAYGYVDKNGDNILGPTYSLARQFREGFAWVMFYDSQYWSIIDMSGQTIASNVSLKEPGRFSDGLSIVYRNGMYAAIKSNGEVSLWLNAEEVRGFNQGYAVVKKGGKWGLINVEGKLIIPYEYLSLSVVDGGVCTAQDQQGCFCIRIAKDTPTASSKRFLGMSKWSSNVAAAIDSQYRYGLINLSSEWISDARWSYLSNFAEGYAVAQAESGLLVFVDATGQEISVGQFIKAWPPENGYALAFKDANTLCCFDAKTFKLQATVTIKVDAYDYEIEPGGVIRAENMGMVKLYTTSGDLIGKFGQND